MGVNSNLVEMRGEGLDRSLIRISDFIASLIGGGPTSLRIRFPAASPPETLIARLVDPFASEEGRTLLFDGSPPPAGSLPANIVTAPYPAQLSFVRDQSNAGEANLRIVRGPAAAVAGTTYSASIVIAKYSQTGFRYYTATLDFLAT